MDAALFDMLELLEPDRDVVVDEPGDAMAPALALDEPVVRRAKRAVFESPEERLWPVVAESNERGKRSRLLRCTEPRGVALGPTQAAAAAAVTQ